MEVGEECARRFGKRINCVKKELENCSRGAISQESVNREHLLRYKLERLQDQ